MTSAHTLSRIALAALLATSAGACVFAPASVNASSRPTAAAARSDAWVVQRLYFGRDIPDGGSVDEGAWATFLREVATPRFPDGMTTYETKGQWLGANGQVVTEDAFVLEVMHPVSSGDGERKVREIAEAYRIRFRQEAVLWTRDVVEARFLSGT